MRRFPFVLGLMTMLAGCSSQPEESESKAAEEAEASANVAADPENFPDVVARVNGTDILKSELLDRVASIDAQARGAVDTSSMEFYRSVLDDLVGAELLFQESTKRQFELKDEEVDARIAVVKNRMPDPAMFEQALASEGLTLEQLRGRLHRDMSIQKLVDADVTPRVTVSEDEARKYYDENLEQMRQPERLRLSHILKRVAPDAAPEAKEAVRTEIQAVLEQARSGGDFAALAREHSEDPGSTTTGGQLTVARGDTVPPFEEAAFALSPGGLSPVVETQFGFHIIKLTEKIPGQVLPYAEVEARIQEFLKERAIQEEVNQEVDSLRASSEVEILM